jgi:hypothetical protein
MQSSRSSAPTPASRPIAFRFPRPTARLQPPAFTEGFDQLYIVHRLPDYVFSIRECDRRAQDSSAQP